MTIRLTNVCQGLCKGGNRSQRALDLSQLTINPPLYKGAIIFESTIAHKLKETPNQPVQNKNVEG